MKVTPIEPIYRAKNQRRQNRAFVGVGKPHRVFDTETGESFALPPTEAWELNEKLNRGVIA